MSNENYVTELLQGSDGIERAKRLLRQGDCVALPTETVYGLAANAESPAAVEKIFAAKGRPSNHPLIVHIPGIHHLQRWASDVPVWVEVLAARFWPGPLTMILKAKPGLNNPVTGGLSTVALRVPAHPIFLRILTELDMGLAAPSANRYKSLSPTCSEQAFQQLKGRIKAVLEGGHCEHGIESTIIDLTGEHIRILRAGPITAADIEQCIQAPVEVPVKHDEVVPGNVAAHYQPDTPVKLLSEQSLLAMLEDPNDVTVHYLVYSPALKDALKQKNIPDQQHIRLPAEPADYAKNMYYSLYQLDKPGASEIRVEMPPSSADWLAVNDRLSRAASN